MRQRYDRTKPPTTTELLQYFFEATLMRQYAESRFIDGKLQPKFGNFSREALGRIFDHFNEELVVFAIGWINRNLIS